MKQILQKMKQYVLVVLLVLMGNYGWGQTIVNHTFSSTSGSIDSNIAFTSQKNSSSTVPAFSSGLRLYSASNGSGCSITLTPSNGAIITQVKITAQSTYTPTVKFNVDGGADVTASLTSLVYTISGISSTSNLKIRNANTTNTQWRINSIEVTYNMPSSNDTTSKVEPPTTQISSIDLPSLVTEDNAAVEVFKFNIRDAGTADGLATKVTQVSIKKASGTADWTDHIAGVSLWDGANQITTGTATITDTDITIPITSGNLDIGDGTSKEISLKLWLKTTNIVDNATMAFTISSTGHGFISDPSGSSFASDFGSAVTSNTMSVRIEATKMIFTQQPTSLEVNATMNPSVEVKYVDVNNNVDIDASNLGQTATLSATGATLSGTTTTAGTPVNGVMTFSDISFPTATTGVTLTVTDSGTVIIGGATVTSTAFNINEALPATPTATEATNVGSFQFDANWNAVAGATSYRLDVMTSLINSPFINEFHYDNSTSNDPNEFIEIVVPNSYTGVDFTVTLYNGNGGVSYETYTLNDFVLGQSYSNYKVYSKTLNNIIQNGAPDGFSLSDNAGLIEFISYEGTFTATNGPANGATSNDVGVLETNSTPEGSSIQKTGDFGSYSWVVSGINSKGTINASQTINDTYISGFENLNVGNVSTYTVSGLNQNTTYYYRVRAVNGAGATISSNVITVQTPIASTTWNGTTWSNSAPTASIDAIIDGDLTTTTDLVCKDLTINSGKTLTIGAGKKLTVSGNLINNGTIIFKSDATGTAMFDVYNGSQSSLGVTTVERYIPLGKRAFRLLSPAVTTSNNISNNWQQQTHITGGLGTTGLGFDATATNNPSMYTYNNQVVSGSGWASIANTNATNLTAGVGYRVLIRGNTNVDLALPSANTMNAAITLSATGILTTGPVTINDTSSPVATNNQLNATTAGYSLVGNPYQSAVDWHAVIKSGIDGAYYAWDPNRGSGTARGNYVSYNFSSGNSDSDSQVGRYIQPGQAFFVKNTTLGTAGTLTFQEAHKATTSANVFRTSNETESANFASLSVQLYDPNELAIGGYPIDATKAVFSSDYTNELGLGDATKLEAASENIAWFRNNTKLAIDAAAPVTITDELVMKTLRLGANKDYTFKIQTTNFDSALTPYLVDTFLNTQTEITTSQAYLASFATTTNVASYSENRFKIVFTNSILSTDTFATQVGLYPNPSKGNGFYLQLPSTTKATVKLYNTIGQEIAITNNEGHYQANQSLASGVYHILVTQEEKTSKLKWIVE